MGIWRYQIHDRGIPGGSFFALFGFRVFLKNCPHDFAETHAIASGQYLSAGTKFMPVALLGGRVLSLKNQIFGHFSPFLDFFPIFSKTARTIRLKTLSNTGIILTPTLFESLPARAAMF